MRVFGEDATYTPQGQGGVAISGAFDAQHQEVDVQTGVPVSTVGPVLGVRLADLPQAPAQGDQVTVRGVGYVVADIEPDGHGGALLRLHEV